MPVPLLRVGRRRVAERGLSRPPRPPDPFGAPRQTDHESNCSKPLFRGARYWEARKRNNRGVPSLSSTDRVTDPRLSTRRMAGVGSLYQDTALVTVSWTPGPEAAVMLFSKSRWPERSKTTIW